MNLADLFWSLLSNPNVDYVLLVVGLWTLVLAVAVPGTGLPEATAVICLVLAGIGLAQLPVNLAAVGLIGLAVVLFVLELKLATHGAFALGGTLTFAAGSLLLFNSAAGEETIIVSRWLVGGTTLATLAFFVFALGKVLETQRKPPAQSLDAVLGATGEARTPIDGSGSVYVGGELWSARADEAIAAGEKVVVVKRDGLTVQVAKAK
jgi:membrane-bound serine protease (ClpP class)